MTTNEAKILAESMDISFIETSARMSINVDEAFELLTNKMCAQVNLICCIVLYFTINYNRVLKCTIVYPRAAGTLLHSVVILQCSGVLTALVLLLYFLLYRL